jgi:hypothetical protein
MWPSGVFDLLQQIYEASPVAKLVIALGAMVTFALIQRYWRNLRIHLIPSRPARIAAMTRELNEQDRIHNSNVAFMSRNNIYLSWILLLGFLYVAGSNLERYSKDFEAHVLAAFKQLGALFGAWSGGTVDWYWEIVKQSLLPLAFWLLAFMLANYCRLFLRFNKHHRDFASYKQRMLSAIHRLKQRVIALPDQISEPAPDDESAAQAVQHVGATRSRAPAPAAPAPAVIEPKRMETRPAETVAPPRDAGAVQTQAQPASRIPGWRVGRVTKWPEGGWFGYIESVGKFGDKEDATAEREVYWTNVSRLITSTTPKVGDEVFFIEHHMRPEGRNKVAVLVGTVGQECEGDLATPPGPRRFRFAEVKDARGNSARLLVLPPKGASLDAIAAGARVVFDLGRNEIGPMGINTRAYEGE